MKRRIALLLAALCLLSGMAACKQEVSQEEWEAQEIDRVRPIALDARFYDVQGNYFRMADDYSGLMNKPVVMHFWAARSPVSTAGLDAYQAAYEQYGSEVQFLMIYAFDGESDSMEEAEMIMAEKDYTFPVFYDRDYNFRDKFKITQFPYTFFFAEKCQLKRISNQSLTLQELGELIAEIKG